LKHEEVSEWFHDDDGEFRFDAESVNRYSINEDELKMFNSENNDMFEYLEG